MYIELDLTSVPLKITLRDPDNFTELKVVTGELPAHTYIDPDTLQALAPERSDPQAWRDSFATMVLFAKSNGWVDERGAIRAHIEYGSDRPSLDD